ncbi:BTAD domain-containing putative transcriptional regulator [Planotetraspora sp. GP83]|uniref:AfsR/SARP family transcriptional regulator n=1 Tax=Planotetraspora sp. GP83 TaxID=3156264 RepID=UPI003514009E
MSTTAFGGTVAGVMEFRLLGAVEAYHDGQRLGLGPRKQRLTLGILALEANRPVPMARLVELNWPESPPRTAEHAVRVAVSQLRSVFGQITEVELRSQGSGYMLRTDPLNIDVHLFRDLLQRARAALDDQARLSLLEAALSLWRGPALAGAASPEVQERLGGGLEEARLAAIEDRIDTELRLARHRDLLEELTALTRAHPFRERLTCQLMTALYRSGQTHVALEVARKARRLLADELGIDPCPEFRQLETAILRNDPVLPPPGRAAQPQPLTPAQLPPAVSAFTGRTPQLRWLDELAGDLTTPVAVAIIGPPGTGKSALAVHWAHRVRHRFPDGQLYIDLHEYGSRRALPRFLRSLGVSEGGMPVGPDEAAALYRTLLAGRRMLVLLDNAVTSEQVRPLLPGAGGSLTLTTSRERLSGLIALDGARPLRLQPLNPGEARDLLTHLLGPERVRREAEAAARLAELCDYLPAALRLAAADLSYERTIADVVADLEEQDDIVLHAAPPIKPPERRKLGLAGLHCNRTMRQL